MGTVIVGKEGRYIKYSRCREQGHNRTPVSRNAPFLTVGILPVNFPRQASLEEDAGAATVNDILQD